jgi:hypothetical protein
MPGKHSKSFEMKTHPYSNLLNNLREEENDISLASLECLREIPKNIFVGLKKKGVDSEKLGEFTKWFTFMATMATNEGVVTGEVLSTCEERQKMISDYREAAANPSITNEEWFKPLQSQIINEYLKSLALKKVIKKRAGRARDLNLVESSSEKFEKEFGFRSNSFITALINTTIPTTKLEIKAPHTPKALRERRRMNAKRKHQKSLAL